MSETLTVNELVTKHAEELQEKGSGEKSQTSTDEKTTTTEEPDLKAELERLKKENEELKKPTSKKEPEKAKTPEELAKEKVIYDANLIQFAATTGDLKPEDFTKLDTLRSKADRDLVFERFSADHKEDNPDADPDEIQNAFDEEYKIKSVNDKVRQRGEQRMAKEAGEIRTPLTSSYEKVKGRFDSENEVRQNYPAFSSKVDEITAASIPTKIDVFKDKDGEEEVSVDLDLTDAQRKDIAEKVAKKMNSPKTYALYKEGKLEDIQKKTQEVAEALIWKEYRQDALKKVAATYNERGIKKAKVGPNNPFPLNDKNQSGNRQKGNVDAEQEVLDSLQGKK